MATISDHPRFKLARALLTGQGGEGDIKSEGNPAAAIDIFAALLEECRSKGDKSLNAALCQFEYGNALFRAAARRTPMDGDANAKQDEESDKKPAAKNDVMASAAMKRSAGVTKPSPNKRAKTDDSSDVNNISSSQDASESAQSDGETGNNTEDDEDIELAYEMMDTSWRILLSHITNGKENSDGGDDHQQKWALEQIPRVIRCIGDLYFFQQEYANAVDCYLRAMQYREEAWDKLKQQSNGNGSDSTDGMLTLEHLQCQRYLVEICALVAEALLACPAGEDVVCYLDDDSEKGGDAKDENESSAVASAKGANGNTLSKEESRKGTVLANAKDRLDYAQSHYELAREGLEEILCRYGKMAAANIDVGNEKEDIGYLVMSLVDVGQTIQNH